MQFVRGQAGTNAIYKAIINADGEDINAFDNVIQSYTGKNLKTIFKNFIIANWWNKSDYGNPPSNYSYNDTGIYVRGYGKPRTTSAGKKYDIQELSNIYVEYDNSSLSISNTDNDIHYLCINGSGNIDETSPYNCSASGSTNGVLIVWNEDTLRENYSYDMRSTGTLPNANIIHSYSIIFPILKANFIISKRYPIPDPLNKINKLR